MQRACQSASSHDSCVAADTSPCSASDSVDAASTALAQLPCRMPRLCAAPGGSTWDQQQAPCGKAGPPELVGSLTPPSCRLRQRQRPARQQVQVSRRGPRRRNKTGHRVRAGDGTGAPGLTARRAASATCWALWQPCSRMRSAPPHGRPLPVPGWLPGCLLQGSAMPCVPSAGAATQHASLQQAAQACPPVLRLPRSCSCRPGPERTCV